MPQERRYPVISVRTTGGIGIKQITNNLLNALSDYTFIEQIVIDKRNEMTPENPRDFIVFTGNHMGNWLCHKFFKSRSEIFSLDFASPNSSSKAQETFFIYGEISFSQDGDKITVTAPLIDKNGYLPRISTDIKILEHIFVESKTRSNTVYWYYDPEENQEHHPFTLLS